MSDTTTNPKPHTLPVLDLRHERTLSLMAVAFEPLTNEQEARVQQIEAVVRALASGTHELQERASGDTVRVSREGLEDVESALFRSGLIVWARQVRRWLSGDKP